MSFNAWEAKNLIGGQKYVVAMSILKNTAVTEFTVISH